MKEDTNSLKCHFKYTFLYPQQMQPNPPNQSPDEKPHAVGFKTDEERVIFFQNVAELMWRDGVIKRNTIPDSWNMLLLRQPISTCIN